MKTLYLVRHGETKWNKMRKVLGRKDIPLNNVGVGQAQLLGKYFQEQKVDIIISSPLIRAYKTAQMIGESIGKNNIKIYPELIERDYGVATGLTYKQRQAKYPEGKTSKNQESKKELRNRAINIITEIDREYNNQRVVIGSHGAIINNLIAYFTKEQYGTGKMFIANCSVSKIVKTENGWKVKFINRIFKSF